MTYLAALNRLAKWRTVFAGWQLGTRAKDDPESQAVRDHREATLIHRVEISALAQLLISKGIITVEDFEKAIENEAALLDHELEQRFPGFKATDEGMNLSMPEAFKTMHGWLP